MKWIESHSVMSNSLWPHGLYSPWNFPGQNTGVSSLSLLQGIFSTQGSNPGIPHCRLILYQLSRKGNPRILEWVAYPFSSRSSRPRNGTGVSCIASGFFTSWVTREAPSWYLNLSKSKTLLGSSGANCPVFYLNVPLQELNFYVPIPHEFTHISHTLSILTCCPCVTKISSLYQEGCLCFCFLSSFYFISLTWEVPSSVWLRVLS